MSSPLTTPEDLAAIRQELNDLRATVSAMRDNGHHNGNGRSSLSNTISEMESDQLTDRRAMLKKVGAIAAGVAAVGLLRPSGASAAGFSSKLVSPNATGGPLLIGGVNAPSAAADSTILQNPGSVMFPNLFRATNWNGVIYSQPANTIRSIVGHINDSASTPAGQEMVGVYGQAIRTGTGQGTGVLGEGTDFGVEGSGSVGVSGSGTIGVLGTGSGGGCGCDGVSDGNSTVAFGVRGTAATGLGGFFSGGRGAIGTGIGSGAVANPNIANPSGSTSGDLYRGSTASSLWYKAAGANPYRRLADDTTAGALSLFAASTFVINTTVNMGGGLLAAGGLAAYQISGLGGVPAGARAIVGRIANPNEVGTTGSILVSSANPPVAGTGVIGVVPSLPIQNQFFVSALDATGKLYVKNNSNGATDIIIAVTGYYL